MIYYRCKYSQYLECYHYICPHYHKHEEMPNCVGYCEHKALHITCIRIEDHLEDELDHLENELFEI